MESVVPYLVYGLWKSIFAIPWSLALSRLGRSNTVNLKHSLLEKSPVHFAGGKPSLPAKKPLAFKSYWRPITCTACGSNSKLACRWNHGYLNFTISLYNIMNWGSLASSRNLLHSKACSQFLQFSKCWKIFS